MSNEGDLKNLPQQKCNTCGHRRDEHMETLTCCKWVDAKIDEETGETIKIKKYCECNTFKAAA